MQHGWVWALGAPVKGGIVASPDPHPLGCPSVSVVCETTRGLRLYPTRTQHACPLASWLAESNSEAIDPLIPAPCSPVHFCFFLKKKKKCPVVFHRNVCLAAAAAAATTGRCPDLTS
jgi:hypothetical protein